ncbi:hypothetical protein FAGAP_10954 [Fusarium agapanthi]|uniref:BTB domain-containing protein n=1 Tax=Fusarium agapanthi TaxID=1803897 RepID=A0A9P5B0R2_9HYPO|nr:hypothetical protein FAGAP_10954 [Fusarium agapanthi]
MSTTRIEIDPEGDTLVIIPVKLPSTQSETPNPPDEKHFLCSKKHLTLASRRAARLFSSQFREASVESDGLYHWKFEAIFNHEAFSLVSKIIHGKTRGIPRTIKLDLLADIATIVDDLQCHEAVAYFSENWLLWWPSGSEEPRGKALAQLILASFVFEHASLFETYTKLAIRHSDDVPSTFGLPIRADVLSQIENTRTQIFEHLFDGLDKLYDRILDGSVGCNPACQALRLGSLLQARKKLGLYPRPSSPFPKLSLDSLLASLATVQSPAYFGLPNQGPVAMYSGKWSIENSTTVVVTRGFFGGQSKSTQPGTNNASVSSPQPSGLLGLSAVSQNTNNPPTRQLGAPPQPTVGLFGSSTASQSPASGGSFGKANSKVGTNTPAAENQEQPAIIVKHKCRLKDLIEPLVMAAEKEITGLKLADFPRP